MNSIYDRVYKKWRLPTIKMVAEAVQEMRDDPPCRAAIAFATTGPSYCLMKYWCDFSHMWRLCKWGRREVAPGEGQMPLKGRDREKKSWTFCKES